MANKISGLIPKGTALQQTDLIEISESDGQGGFVTKSVTGQNITSGVTALTTTNILPKVDVNKRLINSLIFDNGTNVGIGTTTPVAILDVNGDILVNGIRIGRGIANLVSNTAIGVNTINANTTGASLVAVGRNALQLNTTGNFNVAIGDAANRQNQTGSNVTAIGHASLLVNTASSNTALGAFTLAGNTTGTLNTAIGSSALVANTIGSENVSVGSSTLSSNLIGNNNVGIGVSALLVNLANNNTAIGKESLVANTIGISNSALGVLSLSSNTTGSNNVGIGQNSGRNLADGVAFNTITDNSIFIGRGTRALANNQTNQIVIGDIAIGLGSNSVVLGNSSIMTTALRGQILIGTTVVSTSAQLQIDSTTRGFLPPRMSTTEKNAIAAPAVGLVLYDTTLNKLCVRTASAWETITST